MELTGTQISPRNFETRSSGNTLPSNLEAKPWAQELVKAFPSNESLLVAFNPSRQAEFARYQDRCLMGDAPSINRVALVYGHNTAKSWLEIQLRAVGEYAGVRDKQSVEQLSETAATLLVDYYYLKLTEWMLFFHQLKAGHYGSFYGAVDGMRIGEALKQFVAWRTKELQRLEAEAAKAKKAEEDKAHDERVRQFRAEGGRPNVQQLLQEIQAEREAKRKAEGKSHQQRLAEFKRKYLK